MAKIKVTQIMNLIDRITLGMTMTFVKITKTKNKPIGTSFE